MSKSIRHQILMMLLVFLWASFPLTASSNCEIDFDILKKDGDGWQLVQGNGPVRSGDLLRIQIEASLPCFFVFFWRDSHQHVFNLTPDAQQHAEGVRAVSGQRYTFPKTSYRVDETIGKEHLVLVFSESPITGLNNVGKAIALQQVADLVGPSFIEQYSVKWRVIIHSER